MPQSRVTLKEIVTAVREFTFDRFIIPAFAIKSSSGKTIKVLVDKAYDTGESNEENILGRLLIVDNLGASHSFDFQTYGTMESLIEAVSDSGFIVAYTPYFRGVEPSTTLIPLAEKTLIDDNSVTLFRRYFFSDDEVYRVIRDYYRRVLDIYDVELNDDIVGRLQRPSEEHMALWVSYFIIERRRLYEQASAAIGQSFNDGTDYVGSDVSQGSGASTTTQIGSVFTITEDPTRGYFYEDFNRVGSDNTLGDRFSFWYRLQIWIRQQLEEVFGDYSLRKTNVLSGYIELTRELDFRSYFDSYPFTLSPLSRGILSKT